MRERGLARAAGADDQEPLAGSHVEVDPAERGGRRAGPARADPAQTQTRSERGCISGRQCLGGQLDRDLLRHGRRDALGGAAHLPPRRRGQRHGREHLEHRHGNEDGDREARRGQHAVRHRRRGGDDRGEGCGAGKQRHDRRGAGLGPRTAHDGAPEGVVGVADACAAAVLGAERDEHVEVGEVVEDGIGEATAQRRDVAFGARSRNPAPAPCGQPGGEETGE